MDPSFVDPVKQFEYQQLVDKRSRVNKSNSNDEFLNVILEKIYLSNILHTNGFIDEEDNDQEQEPEDVITFGKNKIMDDYTKSNILSQLVQDDTFGLKEAFKKRGFFDVK